MDFSYSFSIINKDIYNDVKKGGKGIVFAVWHCFFYSFVFSHKFMKITAIVSQSKDGNLGAFLLNRYGFIPIRGSSSKGGTKALLQAKGYLDRGHDIVIAIDGPRGPRFDVKPGAIYLAKMSNLIILPVIFKIGRFISFNSWDRFVLPLPFTNIAVIYGEPILLNTSREKKEILIGQEIVKKGLTELTNKYAKNIL
jgi:hypothetical protein